MVLPHVRQEGDVGGAGAQHDNDSPADFFQSVTDVGDGWSVVVPSIGRWNTEDDLTELLHYTKHDADVVYPAMVTMSEEGFEQGFAADEFCSKRIQITNFIPPAYAIRTELLGDEDDWTRWKALADKARFKACIRSIYVYPQVWDPPVDEDAGRDLEATFYSQASPANTILRCIHPSRYLKAQTTSEIKYVQDENDYWYPLHRGKAAIMQFAGDKAWAAATLGMEHKGIRVLIETDDNYTVSAGRIQQRANWGSKIGDTRHTLEGHMWILQHASGVIVTTEQLAGVYRKFTENVYICPNQIDPPDWPEPQEHEDLVIGWFASMSHTEDAKLIRRAMEWASRQPGVKVVTAGFNPTWHFDRYHEPWVNDLTTYRRLMSHIDIGMAPVTPTPWSIGRSDIKALEYAMSGALPIVSDQPPYSNLTHEENCLKAKTAKDFYHHVKWAVRNRDEVRELARMSREYVLKERTVEKNAWRWQEAIDG